MMDEATLQSIIDGEIANAHGFSGGELSAQRALAMEYYLGQPFGNEVEGRSQVVLTDVADTVEWIMPSLLRIFTGGKETVVFDPTGPEDEEIASQATDYINHVFMKDNRGFMVFYTWFKDALLQKNGAVKYYWSSETKKTKEPYEGLTDEEFIQLMVDEDLEPIEHTLVPTMEGIQLHDVTFERIESEGKIVVEPVPPEELLVHKRTRWNIQKSPFVCHRTEMTISDLREIGYSEDKVKEAEDATADDDLSYSEEASARNLYDDDEPLADPDDESLKRVIVYESYLKVDYDGDGIAELRKVTTVGKIILDNEEIDHIPFAVICPIPIPHKHYGLSIADLLMDLQLIRSTVLRQILDNMYNLNNGRWAILENAVNLDDLLRNRPGGIVREKIPGAVRRLDTPQFNTSAFSLLEYMESIKENRSGVTRYNQGLDANSLNKTASGISQIMTAAQQRVELIARIFAETGVADLFRGILMLVCKHQQKERVIRLRGQWVEMDPREWDHNMDLSINVGIGIGDKQQQVENFMMLLDLQKQIIELGGVDILVGLPNIYNTLKKLLENMGQNSAEPYFIDPTTVEMPEGGEEEPSPEEQKAQMDIEMAQAKNQLEMEKMQMELQSEREKLEIERQENEMKLELLMAKHAVEMEQLGFKKGEMDAARER